MNNHEQKNLILKIPKILMTLIRRKALAFCAPRKSLIRAAMLFAVIATLFYAFHYFLEAPIFVMLIPTVAAGLPTIFFFALYVSSAIVIRKDCYECQLGFHITAHEQTHLRLNSLDEAFVEEETLKQTGDRLIPILLSNPILCKDCLFRWRKMYCQATSNYLKKS